MITEKSDFVSSSTGNPGNKVTEAERRNREPKIEQLRTFSRSLENLTEETLYSKWKRARGAGITSTHRARSISLTTAPVLKEIDDRSKPERKNSFHVLQENVFRPRGWTIGANLIEAIKEHGSATTRDINNNEVTREERNTVRSVGAQRRRKLGKQYLVALQFPVKQPGSSHAEKQQNSTTNKVVTVSEVGIHGGKQSLGQAMETRSEVVFRPSQKLRRVSEELEDPPIVARFLSEGDSSPKVDAVTKKTPGNLHLEAVTLEIPAGPASMPASPNFSMREKAACPRPEGQNKLTGVGLGNLPEHDAFKLGKNNKRVMPERNNFSLGCTYAVVSQPSLRKDQDIDSQKATMTAAGMITKEQRVALEEEFKVLQRVSLELDKDEMGDRKFKKSYSFHDGSTKGARFVSQPSRRFSDQNSHRLISICSNRPTAKAILEDLTKVGHKTEKQRVESIEKAFEWIKKELAELRAQDKDIMRTFTKVQAGIRRMKLQRTISGSFDGDFDPESSDRTTDLSASFSYVPLVRELTNTFPRRASLI